MFFNTYRTVYSLKMIIFNFPNHEWEKRNAKLITPGLDSSVNGNAEIGYKKSSVFLNKGILVWVLFWLK